tara:strand:- start:5437 stop:5859 length:423 start_codon:yes stop_codon:yes gene_type:complete
MLVEYLGVFIGLWLVLATIVIQQIVLVRVHRSQKGYKVGVIDPSLGQSSLFFRAHRTFWNSMENIVPLMGFSIIAIITDYNPQRLTNIVWIYAVMRIIHMILYYAIVTDKNPSPRSIFFIIGFGTTFYLMIDLLIHLVNL